MPRTKSQSKAQTLVKKLKKETRFSKTTKTWKRKNLDAEISDPKSTKTEQYKNSMWVELRNHSTYVIYKDGVEHTRLTVSTNVAEKNE
jgi:hypothetical protein